MKVILYGVQENAGGWRFVGPAHKTIAAAEAFVAARKAAFWLYETKISKIHRLSEPLKCRIGQQIRLDTLDVWANMPEGLAPS